VSSAWHNGEKGGSKLKTVFALAIVAALVFAVVKIVPVYVTNYQLQDSMQEEATFASVNRKSADQIKTDMEKRLENLGISVDPSTIEVSAFGGNVQISLEYTIPVDLTVYQLQLHFHPQADNASI
jgi:YbbR domain-containing protein